jgi:hypothetical protein
MNTEDASELIARRLRRRSPASIHFLLLRSDRSHGGNTGSNPVGDATREFDMF